MPTADQDDDLAIEKLNEALAVLKQLQQKYPEAANDAPSPEREYSLVCLALITHFARYIRAKSGVRLSIV